MKLIEFTAEPQNVAEVGSVATPERGRLSSRVPIIIAEDDPVSQALLVGLLRNAGYDPIITSNGSDAMTTLRLQQKPCIAIVDWMMPVMDGAEVCRRIRASGKMVHIIMLTARDRKEDTIEALDAGADDYLVKPFDRGELLARVRAGMRTVEALAVLAERADALERFRGPSAMQSMQLPL
jgi:DNA-binding response OmpR family regulator